MSLSVAKGLSVAKVAKQIGVPVKKWPGACYFIASEMVKHKIVDGRARYGHWLGPIAKDTMFSGRMIVHHGWVEAGDTIVDPTRFVFEGVKPYIYIGPNSQYYDIGGNKLHDAMHGRDPFPRFVSGERSIVVPEELNYVLDVFKIEYAKKLCISQLFWLANKPYYEFNGFAKMFYEWLIKNGFGALIPIDNKEFILGD